MSLPGQTPPATIPMMARYISKYSPEFLLLLLLLLLPLLVAEPLPWLLVSLSFYRISSSQLLLLLL